MKKFAAKLYAGLILRKLDRLYYSRAVQSQNELLGKLIKKSKNTLFGREHGFSGIKNYEDFKKQVPLTNYEKLLPYINKIENGQKDVLYPGLPKYLAKTSGSTAGAKHIPLTLEQLKCQINSTRNMLLRYIARSGNTDFASRKVIFIQGSPKLEKLGRLSVGRLSGIVALHTPWYVMRNRLPSYKTNCIADWQKKIEMIVEETSRRDMGLISGIPPWLVMYFEQLNKKSGKKAGELFPNLSLLVTGGVSIEPYIKKLHELIGRKIDWLETYPASEGFIAASDSTAGDGSQLLCLESGLFYEFVPVNEFHSKNPVRIGLKDVELNTNYAIILSSNAGLWSYAIGDTVMFTSLEPHRIKVTGRVSHYISAFGEHVITSEVERAMIEACRQAGCSVKEFTVAPMVNPEKGLPYHEWFVEFGDIPENIDAFSRALDNSLRGQNIYYNDLINDGVLRPAVVREMPVGSFERYMKKVGKFGEQNKPQKLANDRHIADALTEYLNENKIKL